MASPATIRIRKTVTKATAKQQMLRQLVCSDAPEQALRYCGYRVIAGVDEVGRGALFGPVVAAAVILPDRSTSLAKAGLKDSKQMLRKDREKLDRRIRKIALAVSVAEVDAETIDRVNILQATRRAMGLALGSLGLEPELVLTDFVALDGLRCPQRNLVNGDQRSATVAAASIIAKVTRDRMMAEADREYPQYGFGRHKGYATLEHLAALIMHGPCPLHRRTFNGVIVQQDLFSIIADEE